MRIIQASDNGNVTFNPPEAASEAFNENRSWLSANPDSNAYENRTDNSRYNTQCNAIYSSTETTETFINYSTGTEIGDSSLNVEFVVCNRQYRINAQNNINCTHSLPKVNILEESNESAAVRHGNNVDESNVYSDDTPIDDDRVFDHSDTDDMSEKGVNLVPRGIVNPNYPGFQHLAHTLQDYSSNIENFYQSENDMTDDDVDIEITELVYEPEDNQNIRTTECKNINNNNIRKDKLLSPKTECGLKLNTLDSHIQNDIPDLIKNISKNSNNNGNDNNFDLNCTDTDIENNFNTKDIIGDFNKEVEEEIKHLLNYNINIQEDLEELRRDIKDTFAKPIENTINNISDVVNHVIKKLVETNAEVNDDPEIKSQTVNEDISKINRENEKNTRTEMNLSRPTFLFIGNNTNQKIDDAILSDGKDEINISEYDPDKLSQNVENTIKQLSTELRKIIPKLDEMRERDRLWAERNKENVSVKDGNSNEIGNSSNSYNVASTVNTQIKTEISKSSRFIDNHAVVRSFSQKSPVYNSNTRIMRNRQNDVASNISGYQSAQSNTSVRKHDSPKDLDLESFDVYNIETALPKLDIDAIENHLRAAKEAERRTFVSNIKRKFSKTSEEHRENIEKLEKPGFRRGLHLFKLKISKSEAQKTPAPGYNSDDEVHTALSPRAINTADSAHTEIEWPALIDNNPNILDKFTRIVTIAADAPYDKKKRNDREEIRKRLAMGADAEEYYSLGHTDRPGKKPSLHSRLQSGMNLQICFMNETASDNESQSSDLDRNVNYSTKSLSRSSIFSKSSFNSNHPYQTRPLSVNITKHDKISTVQSGAKLRPSSLTKTSKSRSTHSLNQTELKESDFYALQATLQTEARIALAQAKEMARIQMERERRARAVSPVTEMLRRGMQKASAPLAADRRRVSRQLLTDMNIAQLQVIVNELHSQIESLNDQLVKLLMARDELHMGQDSMLVDIEDLTRYLGVKEQTKKTKGTAKTGMKRLTSLVHK